MSKAIILVVILLAVCMSCVSSAALYLGWFTSGFQGGGLATKAAKGAKGGVKGKVKPGGVPKGPGTAAPIVPVYDLPRIPTDCPPGKRGVVGYEHGHLAGRGYMWCKEDGGAGGMSVIGKNRLSYLSVPVGMRATIYEHANFDPSGLMRTFEGGEYDLHQYKFEKDIVGNPISKQIHDRADSIRIEGTPLDATFAEAAPPA